MKTPPVGAELFHAGRRTDGQTHDEANIPLSRSFENAPKDLSLSVLFPVFSLQTPCHPFDCMYILHVYVGVASLLFLLLVRGDNQ